MPSYIATGNMHFATDSNVTIVYGRVIHGRSTEQTATQEELAVRYPGVNFLGEPEQAHISRSVCIEAGATIDLSSDIQISGTSKIGSQAVIRGGTIDNSIIKGVVSGGCISNSTIEQNSSIVAGNINYSTIEGGAKVIGGQINHTKVRGNATVRGGTLNHSLLDNGASVSGGTLNHCTVDNGASVSSGTRNHEKIGGSYTGAENYGQGFRTNVISGGSRVFFGNTHFSSLSESTTVPVQPCASTLRLPPPMAAVDDKFDAEPPKHLVDNLISFALINEAVITPNGDTYDRRTIERHIRGRSNCPVTRDSLQISDLRPNRALQLQIDEWKGQHRIGREGWHATTSSYEEIAGVADGED